LTSTHRLHLVSVVQLYKALGGGWTPDMEPVKDNSKG
jgi:multidrug efflux system outer membrane protein